MNNLANLKYIDLLLRELISYNKVFLGEKELKPPVFLDVTPCSFMDLCQGSGGTDYVLVHGRIQLRHVPLNVSDLSTKLHVLQWIASDVFLTIIIGFRGDEIPNLIQGLV
jgi:hypothetical protein